MQPHTGAIIAVINYTLPWLRAGMEVFAGRTFDIRSDAYDQQLGRYIGNKLHSVKTIRQNVNERTLEFEVGKDYFCNTLVRYDANFEKFEFIRHRYTPIVEVFTIYKGSDRVTGDYYSEEFSCNHKIEGYTSTDHKKITLIDTLEYKSFNTALKQTFELA